MFATQLRITIVFLLALTLLIIPKPLHHSSFGDWFCFYSTEIKQKKDTTKQLVNKVIKIYDLDESYAKDIISFAKKNSFSDFPTVKDILAIIGIESAFKFNAENQGAYGLMQIQAFWFRKYFNQLEDLYDPFTNMRLGIMTLRNYFLKLNNKEDAIIAYQAGIGKFLNGEYTNEYLNRYREELTRYE